LRRVIRDGDAPLVGQQVLQAEVQRGIPSRDQAGPRYSPSLVRIAGRDVAKSTSVLKLDLIAFRRKNLLRESRPHASAMDAKR
jgi:hypothetical protein